MSEVKAYRIITSIHKLPMDAFINAFVERDYSGLILEGEAPDAIVQLTWNDLVEQYNDALKDDGQKEYASAFQDYQKAKCKHDLAVKYIELLNGYYQKGIVVKSWITALNKIVQHRYKFDPDKKEEFIKYLKDCSMRNASNLVNYQLAEQQLLHLSNLTIDDKKKEIVQDHGYFIQIMLNLKSMEGREIPMSISTYEFCLLVNRYRTYVKQMEEQKRKSKR
jgi:hypothetical protein